EHVLLVGQDRLHAGLTGCHRERGKRGCLFRARQQQVFGRGRLKQPIVGSAYYRLSGREEVRDSDSRTELVLVHEQFVVIESQTRINREILEWRETILNVARPRSPSAPVAEHERVCSRKGKNRIGENVSLRILDRREECRGSRIEPEGFTCRGPSKLNPGLQRMSVTGIGVRADEPPIGQSSVLKGHDGSRLWIGVQLRTGRAVEHGKVCHGRLAEQMLPRKKVRLVSLLLALILPGDFLFETIGHLKVRAAENQRSLKQVL